MTLEDYHENWKPGTYRVNTRCGNQMVSELKVGTEVSLRGKWVTVSKIKMKASFEGDALFYVEFVS